mgnify:CR=1 FL=1|tara:strand:- start:160 stop:825 length:666 start_codon:yes stop_codon:yes gene_type:complete
MKYFIGNVGFYTKLNMENYCRNFINGLGEGKFYENHGTSKECDGFDFLFNLLGNHELKLELCGTGIDHFEIKRDNEGWKTLKTFIIRTDKTVKQWSWNWCSKLKKQRVVDDLYSSMRYAIKNQISDFRDNAILICKLCGKNTNERIDYHVDHNNPSFKIIRDDYLIDCEDEFPKKFEGGYGYCTYFKNEDIEFENDWSNYHKKRAHYQILCATCNLTKKKD